MVNKIVVLVDAGYFYAQSCEVMFGGTRRRDELDLDETKTVEMIKLVAKETYPSAEFLRIYWYDAPPSRGQQLSASQEKIALSDGVKLRLGTLNGNGQQKGVDALICRDLEDLSEKKAANYFLLISGDEDLRLGVEFAQSYGVTVKVCGIGIGNASIGFGLAMESDGIRKITKEQLVGLIKMKQNRPVSSSEVRQVNGSENRSNHGQKNHQANATNQIGKSKSAHKRARKSAAKKNAVNLPNQTYSNSVSLPKIQNEIKSENNHQEVLVAPLQSSQMRPDICEVGKPVENSDFVHGIPVKQSQNIDLVDGLPTIKVPTSPGVSGSSVTLPTSISKPQRSVKKSVGNTKTKEPAKKRVVSKKIE